MSEPSAETREAVDARELTALIMQSGLCPNPRRVGCEYPNCKCQDATVLYDKIDALAARNRAEEIEATARWHEEQAAHHRYVAASTRENWTGSDIGEDDLRDNLRYARENDAEAGRHENYAKTIRRELAPISQTADAG